MSNTEKLLDELMTNLEESRNSFKALAVEFSDIYKFYTKTGRISDEKLSELKKLSEWIDAGGMDDL